MLIKKCTICKIYTLKDSCPKCNTQTISPSYKFKQLKDAPKDSAKYFEKKRKQN